MLTVPGRGKGVEVERRRGRHDDAASGRRARLVRGRIDLHDPCRVLVCANAANKDEQRPKPQKVELLFLTRPIRGLVRVLALDWTRNIDTPSKTLATVLYQVWVYFMKCRARMWSPPTDSSLRHMHAQVRMYVGWPSRCPKAMTLAQQRENSTATACPLPS